MFWWWTDPTAYPAHKQFGVVHLGGSHICTRLDRRAAEEKARQVAEAEKARQAAEGMKLHIQSLSEENDQLKLKR
jgi:hypothetical protein